MGDRQRSVVDLQVQQAAQSFIYPASLGIHPGGSATRWLFPWDRYLGKGGTRSEARRMTPNFRRLASELAAHPVPSDSIENRRLSRGPEAGPCQKPDRILYTPIFRRLALRAWSKHLAHHTPTILPFHEILTCDLSQLFLGLGKSDSEGGRTRCCRYRPKEVANVAAAATNSMRLLSSLTLATALNARSSLPVLSLL